MCFTSVNVCFSFSFSSSSDFDLVSKSTDSAAFASLLILSLSFELLKICLNFILESQFELTDVNNAASADAKKTEI